jgi:hypothetical protein
MRSLQAELKFPLKDFGASLSQAIIGELIRSGAIDEDGKSIPGAAGRDGLDSTVAGPKGDSGLAGRDGIDGKSIVGPAGRDAKISIGSVTAGEEASATLREENGVQILDIVLPRGERGADSTVAGSQGPRGEIGPEGLRGYSGDNGFTREQVIELILDMKARGTFKS